MMRRVLDWTDRFFLYQHYERVVFLMIFRILKAPCDLLNMNVISSVNGVLINHIMERL